MKRSSAIVTLTTLTLLANPAAAQSKAQDLKDLQALRDLTKSGEAAPAPAPSKEPGEPSTPKPAPEPKSPIPVTSEGKAALAGSWVADSTSFAKAITASLQKSAGANTKFVLDEIEGRYLATFDLEANQITVEWQEWSMQGTATSASAGENKMTVKVTGKQGYKIEKLSEGELPGARKLELAAGKDSATSKTTFRGVPIKSNVELPHLASGQWSVAENKLYLLIDRTVLQFSREAKD